MVVNIKNPLIYVYVICICMYALIYVNILATLLGLWMKYEISTFRNPILWSFKIRVVHNILHRIVKVELLMSKGNRFYFEVKRKCWKILNEISFSPYGQTQTLSMFNATQSSLCLSFVNNNLYLLHCQPI